MLITINLIEVLEIFRLDKLLQHTIINISLNINKLNDGVQRNEEIFFIKHVFFKYFVHKIVGNIHFFNVEVKSLSNC